MPTGTQSVSMSRTCNISTNGKINLLEWTKICVFSISFFKMTQRKQDQPWWLSTWNPTPNNTDIWWMFEREIEGRVGRASKNDAKGEHNAKGWWRFWSRFFVWELFSHDYQVLHKLPSPSPSLSCLIFGSCIMSMSPKAPHQLPWSEVLYVLIALYHA